MKITSFINHDFQMNNQSEKQSSLPQGQRIKYTREELMAIGRTSATKAAAQDVMSKIKDAPCLKQNEDKDKPAWAPGSCRPINHHSHRPMPPGGTGVIISV